MALDFSQIKAITIPEGSVTRITVGTSSAEWRTIYDGTAHVGWLMASSDYPTEASIVHYQHQEDNFCNTISGSGYTPQLRITFSSSINWTSPTTGENPSKDSNTVTYYGSPGSTSGTFTTTISGYGNSNPFAGMQVANKKIQVYASQDTTNNRLNIYFRYANGTTYGSPINTNYTITKIEQYYTQPYTVLWEKPVEQSWHTLWSGSKTISYNGSNTLSGTSSDFAYSATNKGTSPKIRITFSFSSSTAGVAKIYYYNNSTTKKTTKPTSALTINSASSNTILGIRAEDTSSSSWYKEVKLTRTAGSGRISFSLKGNQNSGPSGATVSMTITKIEQYY